MRTILMIVMLMTACGTEKLNKRTSHREDPEITQLKEIVLELQGTVAQINAFVASDFSDCGTGLPAFEQKICNIAQTATAEQRVIFTQQLATVSKIFQDEIYGDDCFPDHLDAFEPGCPDPTSIKGQLDDLDLSSIESDIAGLQIDVLQLQSDVLALQSRLNDFNGSGNSIETVISGIESDITALESRVDAIEDVLNNADLWKTVEICRDVSPTTGPIFEAVLVQGDRQIITGYIDAGGSTGLGVVRSVGDGDLFTETNLNTKNCSFSVYDISGELNICWDNTDRKATSSDINTACDRTNDLASPTASCTCTY